MTRRRDKISYYYIMSNPQSPIRHWGDDTQYTHPQIRVYAVISYAYLTISPTRVEDGKLDLFNDLFMVRAQAHKKNGATHWSEAYGDELYIQCRYHTNLDLAFKILKRIQKEARITFYSVLKEMVRMKATRVIYDEDHHCHIPYKHRNHKDRYYQSFVKEEAKCQTV